jgi:hypothetical protein
LLEDVSVLAAAAQNPAYVRAQVCPT